MTKKDSDYVRTTLSLRDEETYRWIQNYCKLNDISVSEFTESCWRRFRKEHGEVILPVGDLTPDFLRRRR